MNNGELIVAIAGMEDELIGRRPKTLTRAAWKRRKAYLTYLLGVYRELLALRQAVSVHPPLLELASGFDSDLLTELEVTGLRALIGMPKGRNGYEFDHVRVQMHDLARESYLQLVGDERDAVRAVTMQLLKERCNLRRSTAVAK